MDIKWIGKVARNDFVVDILDKIGKEVDLVKSKVKSLEEFAIIPILNEESVKAWELFMGLSEQSNWTLQDKRERILYILNSNKTFTPQFLQDQSVFFTNAEMTLDEKFSNYHFVIQFTSTIGVPPNMDNFTEFIETNKPAHLTYEFKFRFRIHKELEIYTHRQLGGLTHRQIREKAIINP